MLIGLVVIQNIDPWIIVYIMAAHELILADQSSSWPRLGWYCLAWPFVGQACAFRAPRAPPRSDDISMHLEDMRGLQRPQVTTARPELWPVLNCSDFKMATTSQRPWTSKALIAAAAGTAIFLIGKGLRVSIGKPAC